MRQSHFNCKGICSLAAVIFLIPACHNAERVITPSLETVLAIRLSADSIAKSYVHDRREGICELNIHVIDSNTLSVCGETMYPESKEALIKLVKEAGFACMDSLKCLPDTVLIKKPWALVRISVANLRATPQHNAELISQAILGNPVKILKSDRDWYLVQTPDRYLGWIDESSLTLLNENEFKAWQESVKVIFLANDGWLYTATGKPGVVCDLVAGAILQVELASGSTMHLSLPDGRSGYTSKENFSRFNDWEKQVSPSRENLCTKAMTFLGLPYLWGGTSSKAVDCSGFVKTVYFLNGIILARDASLQFKHGIPIDISKGFQELQKGDLLFFGRKDSLGPRVTHVGMYIGKMEYINASGRVMINTLEPEKEKSNEMRRNALLGARRIIGAPEEQGLVQVLHHTWYNKQ